MPSSSGEKMRQRRISILAWTFGLLVLAGSLLPAFALPQQDVEALLEEATKHIKAGKYEQAIVPLKTAVSVDPKNGEAMERLGLGYLQTQNYKEAASILKQATLLKPDSDFAHGALGAAYQELGQLQEAVDAYKQAVRLKPEAKHWSERLKMAEQASAQSAHQPSDDVIKKHIEEHWRATSNHIVDAAKSISFQFQKIDVKRLQKGVARPTGTGTAGNAIDPLYAANVKFTVTVLKTIPREFTVEHKEEYNYCFYKKPNDANWSGGICEQATPEFIKLDAKVLDTYTGQYEYPATESNPTFILTVTREGDKFVAEAKGRRADFLPISNTEFYVPQMRNTARFVPNDSGHVTHIE